MSKVNCPYHNDDTASMEIYPDSAYCFGCGARVTHKELEAKLSGTGTKYPFRYHSSSVRSYKENIAESIARISKLPTKEIRGFNLPYDDTGYYLVWPDGKYYLKRMWGSDNKNKYKGPAGHRRPIFECLTADIRDQGKTLLVVEGEFNALSAFLSGPWYEDIISPGAASNFNSEELYKYCLPYKRVCVIVDKDAAGVLAGLELKNKLLTKDRRVVLFPVERDFNELLTTEGVGAVAAQIKHGTGQF